MEKVDYEFLSAFESTIGLDTNIVELGARIIGTQGELSIRNILKEKSTPKTYTGVDYLEGPGVDLVANVENIPLPDNSANSIVAMNLFEHVERFWLVFDEMKRIITDEGIVVCATPFNYDIHACPYDYYRFTPFFYDSQFRDFEHLILATVGSEIRPKIVYAVASNNPKLATGFKAFRQDFMSRFRRLIPAKKLPLFKLRSMLCGNFFRDSIRNFGNLNVELIRR